MTASWLVPETKCYNMRISPDGTKMIISAQGTTNNYYYAYN